MGSRVKENYLITWQNLNQAPKINSEEKYIRKLLNLLKYNIKFFLKLTKEENIAITIKVI